MPVQGLGALAQGVLSGLYGGMDQIGQQRRFRLLEEAEARKTASDDLRSALSGLEIEAKYPEMSGRVNELLGRSGSPTSSDGEDPVVQAQQARTDFLAFTAQPTPELRDKLLANPVAPRLIRADEQWRKAWVDANDRLANEAEFRTMPEDRSPANLRAWAAGSPRRAKLLQGDLKALVGPELTAEQRLVDEARPRIAQIVSLVERGAVSPQVAAAELHGLPGGREAIAATPRLAGYLRQSTVAGGIVGTAQGIETTMPGQETAPAPFSLAEVGQFVLGNQSLPVPASVGTARPAEAPRTAGDVVARQKRAEARPPERVRGALARNILEANGIDPDQATPAQIAAANAAAEESAIKIAGARAREQAGAQPGQIIQTDTGYSRVGPDSIARPITTPAGEQAKPKPGKESLVDKLRRAQTAPAPPQAGGGATTQGGAAGTPAPVQGSPRPGPGRMSPTQGTQPGRAPSVADVESARREAGGDGRRAIEILRQRGFDPSLPVLPDPALKPVPVIR